MPNNKFYPAISEILPVEKIPTELGPIKDGLQNIFSKIFYRNLIFEKSQFGDTATIQITLLSYGRIGFDIPGTGAAIIFNPDDTPTGVTPIDISANYKWEILRYINEFKSAAFNGDAKAFFDLFLEILEIEYSELLSEAVTVFIEEPDSLQQVQTFINTFNSKYGPVNNLTLTTDPDTDYFEDILTQLETQNFDVVQMIFEDFIESLNSLDEIFEGLTNLFRRWFGDFDFEDFKKLLIPSASLSINNLAAGIEFPRNIFVPVETGTIDSGNTPIGDPLPEPYKTVLKFNIGSLNFSTENGYEFVGENTFDFPKSFILGTKFTLELDDLKLDLSRTKNIPEAIADGRPDDFIGVYIKHGVVGFPADWGHNSGASASTGELYVDNLLAGTGGISGTIGLRALNAGDPAPLIQLKFGNGFEVELDTFSMTFQQNAITESDIKGAMTIPGFKDPSGNPAKIFIDIHIAQNGEFDITASVNQAIPVLTIPNVFAFDVKSLFFGKHADGRFYAGCSGDIDFLLQPPIGKFLPDKIDINKLIIYDDGKFEIEGGSIHLPKAFELKMGPAKIAITAIHLGSFEKDDRKYKYFGFDGGVSANPGGFNVQGKGIKYYYTVDGPFSSNHKFEWFIRLESLAIDIIIPGSAKPEDAAVIIKGFLSMKDPKIPPDASPALVEVLKNSTEYAGGVYVSIPKFKGLEASASMRMNPKVPAFIVDLGIEISTPILLGTTGLGIYGFRALFGKKYVADKFAADLPADAEWWQYYKAKIDPDFKEGIQTSKFLIKDGFSFGAGVSLATSSDAGKTFSSKLFFLLSLPDVFLFQGQAQFLKDRIKLDANPDPPFFAIIAITKHSIEAGFGINYKMPDTGPKTGKVVTVDGVTELGFFFGNSAAWYFNIGRESPDSYRIQARVLDILNMYFYFMISNSGIRAGAGVNFALKKSFGPLKAELSAYLDTKGRIAFRPKQIGGAIQLGGTVSLKCCGIGFSVSGAATLAAEAPKPHIITGEFEVCVQVLKKKRCAHFEFTWNFDSNLDNSRNPVLGNVPEGSNLTEPADLNKIAKSNHMVSGETLNLAVKVLYDGAGAAPASSIPQPSDWILDSNVDDFRVPVDTFIDIEFKKGLNVTGTGGNLDKLGGISSPSEYIDYVPPQKGKSDRVRHEYFFESIEIKYWDENAAVPKWEDYDFYNALLPMFPNTPNTVGALIDQTTLQNMKWGYWQQQKPGYNNKLRLLATSPLSYAAKTGSLPIENLGVTSSTIFCPGDEIKKTCITFDNDQIYHEFAQGDLNSYKGIMFRLSINGIVLPIPYQGVPNALVIQPGESLEVFFTEPMRKVFMLLNSAAPDVVVEYYEKRTIVDGSDEPILDGGLPSYQYELIDSLTYSSGDWANEIEYEHPVSSVDYIKITSQSCYKEDDTNRNITCLSTTESTTDLLNKLKLFFNTLVSHNHFTHTQQLDPGIYLNIYMGTRLYPNQNYAESTVTLTQGYISGSRLLWTISDNRGYSCNYAFRPLVAEAGFDFNNILSIQSILPYNTGATSGVNYNFIMKVRILINGVERIVDVIGRSCLPMSYCFDNCSTGLYRICYLSHESSLINSTIPSSSQQSANNQTLLDTINKTLQPIWRPNTIYAIRVKTSDRLFRENGSASMGSYSLDMAYGFRTGGPIGHYHKYPFDNSAGATDHQQERKDYAALVLHDKADDFKLSSLKYYIDYDKCYPNADGDIHNAKPLFYVGAELRLFYLYNYVYEFYSNWVDYKHVTGSSVPLIAQSKLDVLIRDPEDSGIPELSPPQLSFVANSIPHLSALNTPPMNINSINNDVMTLNNLMINGNPCVSYTPLAPIDISTKKVLDLKPLKLYTAQFIAKYNPKISGVFAAKDYESVVHSYVFQTSRYADFDEQVNSYVLKKNTAGVILNEAVFVIHAEKAGIPVPQIDLNLAKHVLTNNLPMIPDLLVQQYADQFDRLMNGVFHIDYNKLHGVLSTEFNIIRHPDTDKVLGILIRNPEPFNDPKLPKADPNLSSTEPTETLEVRQWAGSRMGSLGNASDFYVIHSKDRSKMFVTGRNLNFDMDAFAAYQFTFKYKLYNGTAYATVSSVVVEINLSSYTQPNSNIINI
jgi:hypothetical protein